MTTESNPLKLLQALGQSVWLDYIRRDLITTGTLARMIDADGLSGLTSNPAIFEKAVASSDEYAELIASAAREGLGAHAIYERLAMRDLRDAADAFRPVYERSAGRDGYVSLEVSPGLAHDTAGTLAEARRLWQELARPNLMIKVPGTPAGVPAIRELIGEGINVNVTLLFSQAAYLQVAEAYLAGLETRLARGGPLASIASVASFFVSRIDTAIDAQIRERMPAAGGQEKAVLATLEGRIAIANAKLAYRHYLDLDAGERWRRLKAKGARPQRLLWASTGTKDPKYSDVLYVEELVGQDTVNTVPPATFDAFRDHGRARASLVESVDEAQSLLSALEGVGISLDAVTGRLLEEGVRLFADAFDKLIVAVQAKAKARAA